MNKLSVPFFLLFLVFVYLGFCGWWLISDEFESQYRRGYEQASFDMANWTQAQGYAGTLPCIGFRNHLMETKPGAQSSEELTAIYEKYSKGEL